MENKDKPAFALTRYGENYNAQGVGLSKREYFAAMADIPWNAVLDTLDMKYPEKVGKHTISEVLAYRAVLAVVNADALLLELEKSV